MATLRADSPGVNPGIGTSCAHRDATPPAPATRTIVVAIDGPVDRFARLEAAVAAADYPLASRIRRELYRRGWSIVAPRTPSWPGRRS
jgi:hypothetical protein